MRYYTTPYPLYHTAVSSFLQMSKSLMWRPGKIAQRGEISVSEVPGPKRPVLAGIITMPLNHASYSSYVSNFGYFRSRCPDCGQTFIIAVIVGIGLLTAACLITSSLLRHIHDCAILIFEPCACASATCLRAMIVDDEGEETNRAVLKRDLRCTY